MEAALDFFGVFLLGVLYGIGPCTVFCAPILAPMVLSSAKSAKEGLLQGISFGLGRMLSYSVLGAAIGHIGGMFSSFMTPRIFGAFIAIAGVLILFKKMPLLCRVFSKSRGIHATFISGVVVGLAPCYPLVAALALAALSKSAVAGLLIGVLFGLGTMLSPLLLVSLFAGKWGGISAEFQKVNIFISGAFLILLGAITFFS